MKFLSTLFIILFPSLLLHSQTASYNAITTNGMHIGIHSDGTMFMDEEKANAGFIVNSDEGLSTIFSSSIWASAVNLDGKILASTTTYGGQGNEPSFSPGPYATSNFDFNKVWKVESSSILSLIEDFDDGTVDQEPNESILMWPGKGNPLLSNLPNQNFAPFFDQSGDGIYNPMEGDYPVINVGSTNIIPTQMIYVVYNDSSIDEETRVGLEFHTILYTFECESENPINNSVFARHRIVKQESFAEPVYFSLWNDFDLGCITDDAFASIPELNAISSYNIDPIDGDLDGNCQFNINSFGDNPGIQSIVLLNEEINSVSSYISSSVSAPQGMYAPVTPTEKYVVMQGKWRDFTPITEEGNGYNPGNTNITNFIFNGDITDPNQWSMTTSDLVSAPRFPIINLHNKNLQSGQQVDLDIAYIFSQNEELNNIETYNQATDDIEFVQASYNEEFLTTCATTLAYNEIKIDEFNISPNPVNNVLQLDFTYDNFTIYDSLGKIVIFDQAKSTILVSQLPAGFYSILVEKDNIKSVGRFVKL